jgi:hypothetical protein
MKINLESEDSVDIMNVAPRPGVQGKLPLNHGGTNNDLSNIPPYAIVCRVSKTEAEDNNVSPYLYYIKTNKGALYCSTIADPDNNIYPEPSFGTLPISCGGTGYNNGSYRDELVSYLTNVSDYDYTQLFGLWGKAERDSATSELVKKNDKLVLLISENYLGLYNRT